MTRREAPAGIALAFWEGACLALPCAPGYPRGFSSAPQAENSSSRLSLKPPKNHSRPFWQEEREATWGGGWPRESPAALGRGQRERASLLPEAFFSWLPSFLLKKEKGTCGSEGGLGGAEAEKVAPPPS